MTEESGITFVGDYSEIARIPSGFYSLDKALSNPLKGAWGIPLTIFEVYGPPMIGKSTFCFSIAGLIGDALKKSIVFAPIEAVDTSFVATILSNAGYRGDVKLALGTSHGKKGSEYLADENALDEALDILSDEDYGVCILDSVGAISPISEVEGELFEANMGRRAKIMANFMRRSARLVRFRSPFLLLITNHIHQNMGTVPGSSTTGGEALKYLSRVRIRLSKKVQVADDDTKPKSAVEYEGGSYLIGGTVEKLSFGPSKRPFNVFCVAGRGLHKGMSAIWDCITLGLSSSETTIKMGDLKFGYMSKLVKEAEDGHDDVFQPFIDAISEYQLKSKPTEEPDADDSNIE